MREIRIVRPDDETVEIWVDDEHVTTLNHDEDGWAGIDAAVHTTRKLAQVLNIAVKGR